MTLLPTSLAVGVVKGVATVTTTDLGWLWFVVSGLKGTSGRSGGPVESTSYWTLAPPVRTCTWMTSLLKEYTKLLSSNYRNYCSH